MSNIFYPLSLNINGKLCIVIGGGKVALRKVKSLLASGAMVKVISPNIDSGFNPLLNDNPKLSWTKSPYTGQENLKGGSLVFAATNKTSLNNKILRDANDLDIFANVASNSQLGDFIVPASFNQGDLQVSISTSGKVPGLSKAIKDHLEDSLGSEYILLITILEQIRSHVINELDNKTENLSILSQVTTNYPTILKELALGVDANTIYGRLLKLFK